MHSNEELSPQEYKDKVSDYINRNPYPSYYDMLNEIDEKGSDELWHHYENQKIHLYCKKIYENILNDAKIMKYGKLIKKVGGTKALKAMNELFTLFSTKKRLGYNRGFWYGRDQYKPFFFFDAAIEHVQSVLGGLI